MAELYSKFCNTNQMLEPGPKANVRFPWLEVAWLLPRNRVTLTLHLPTTHHRHHCVWRESDVLNS